jgi:hypothetical protein
MEVEMSMEYGYMEIGDERGKDFRMPKGQYTAGQAIGILHLEVWYPLLPGNVVNATTYAFPVRFKALKGGTQDRIHGADPTLIETIIEACNELKQEGVRAIAGACGYLGNFQKEVASAIDIPVYLSSLLQIPFIYRGLKPDQRIGVLCADDHAFTSKLLLANGVTPDIPIAVLGLGDKPQFSNILYSRGKFNYDEIEREVVDGARQLVADQPDIGAILLECSDMPPFARAVQSAVRLPVFDFISMINWIYHGVVQRSYAGIV